MTELSKQIEYLERQLRDATETLQSISRDYEYLEYRNSVLQEFIKGILLFSGLKEISFSCYDKEKIQEAELDIELVEYFDDLSSSAIRIRE